MFLKALAAFMISVYFMAIFAIEFSPWWKLVAVATTVGFIAIT